MISENSNIKSIMIDSDELKAIVKRLGAQITADFKDSDKKLLLVGILKGSVVFLADLMREIDMPLSIDFIQASSYGEGTVSSGKIKINLDLRRADLSDYNVIVVEDILDTGNTLSHIIKLIKSKGAQEVKLCTLLNKPNRREIELTVDYQGAIIPDEFVVGYGLDFDERYRNLPYIGVLKPEVYGC